MLLVRPVRLDDHAQVLALAGLAGIGFTSLPPDPEVLRHKIEGAVSSFAGHPPRPEEYSFLFVLEDTAKKQLVGTMGIYSHVGLSRPFYSYKLSTIVQASQHLGIYSHQKVLHMVNDYTGASEIGSLFLHPDYRRDGIGRFLSRCRFLVFAEFPDMFADLVLAEIRGVQDAQHNSPFYEHLARHFFRMQFRDADYINATQGGQFISDLMPKYPIYVNLLPESAQAVIGKALDASLPALKLLQAEGFRHEGYVDVFDAGPTVQAERRRIRTVRESKRGVLNAAPLAENDGTAERMMIATTDLSSLKMTLVPLKEHEDGTVSIARDVAATLGVVPGDLLRYAKA